MKRLRSECQIFGSLCVVAVALASGALGQTNYVNFEGKQTRPLCLSPDGTRLFASSASTRYFRLRK